MSHKFENEFAASLYEDMLHGMNDDGLGDTADFGWYGLFLKNLSIISEDNYGFVSVNRYESVEATEEAWDILQDNYNDFLEESSYGFGYPDDDYYDAEDMLSDLYDDPFEY